MGKFGQRLGLLGILTDTRRQCRHLGVDFARRVSSPDGDQREPEPCEAIAQGMLVRDGVLGREPPEDLDTILGLYDDFFEAAGLPLPRANGEGLLGGDAALSQITFLMGQVGKGTPQFRLTLWFVLSEPLSS
ncbi:hypothetical protein [Streptomyces sp. NPDC048581]|uniref:hypothetical protein n=1 Tax=unclassified Streptomyces TaxID=2593676 RepID=UPI003722D709